jgi:cold shock CspA family protein
MPRPKRDNTDDQEVRDDRRMMGKIARLNAGFGFIEGSDGRDYFFHWTELDKFSKQFRNLKEHESVEFTPGRTIHGPRAFEIKTTDE